MLQEKNYGWLSYINDALIKADIIPLIYLPKAFDKKKFLEKLQDEFSLKEINLTSSEILWRTIDELKEGLSEKTSTLSFRFSPIEGEVFWLMNQDDIKKITSWIMTQKKSAQSFTSKTLQEGFYRYLVLDVINILEDIDTFSGLSPQFEEDISPHGKGFLTIDFQISFGNSSCLGRLALSQNFQKGWTKHFSFGRPLFKKEIEKTLEIPMHLEVGSTSITVKEWKEAEKGDFLLLDKIKFDPKTYKGVMSLSVGSKTLFHTKIKHNKIKILDYALYHEEEKMQENIDEIEKKDNTFSVKASAEEVEAVEEKLSPLKEMPIPLTVELASFNITLEKLLQIEPGNFLELHVAPEQGVDITANGRKIGRGELVHLGETLGVRLLEIG